MENTKTKNKKVNTSILVYLHFPFSAVTRRLRMANGLAGSPISVPLKTAKQLKHKKKIECSKRDGNTDKTRCFSSYDLTCKTASDFLEMGSETEWKCMFQDFKTFSQDFSFENWSFPYSRENTMRNIRTIFLWQEQSHVSRPERKIQN